MDNIKLLGIPGSLRKESYNKKLLTEISKLLPGNINLELFELKDIPLYNEDLENEMSPESVKYFKEKIAISDGLLIATPEYNYSLPGVLKNAIDWASRPPAKSPLSKKPLCIIGASTGISGTMRAQLHLRQVAVATNMYDMKKPEIIIQKVRDKFDSNGNLTDEHTIASLQKFIKAFEEWILIFKK